MTNTYYQRAKQELDKVNPEDFRNLDHLAEYITDTIPLNETDTDEEADTERDKLVTAVYKAIKEM